MKWRVYYFWISSNLASHIATNINKALVKDPLVIGLHVASFRSFLVRIWILKIKGIEMHFQLCKMQSVLVNRQGLILLYENARPSVARMTVHKYTVSGDKTLLHRSYCPDLSPTRYSFVKHLNTFLTPKIFGFKREMETILMISWYQNILSFIIQA